MIMQANDSADGYSKFDHGLLLSPLVLLLLLLLPGLAFTSTNFQPSTPVATSTRTLLLLLLLLPLLLSAVAAAAAAAGLQHQGMTTRSNHCSNCTLWFGSTNVPLKTAVMSVKCRYLAEEKGCNTVASSTSVKLRGTITCSIQHNNNTKQLVTDVISATR